MDSFNRIVEEKIKRAMEEGGFDNLPGQGKPLDLSDHPHEDPAWRMAAHLLQKNGFTLPWIETWRELESAAKTARQELVWAWERRKRVGPEAESDWQAAQEKYRLRIEAINKRIFDYNLQVPLPVFQRPLVDSERELAEVRQS